MIESLPTILGLAFENIDEKRNFINKVNTQYNIPMTGEFIMEKLPLIIGTKKGKIVILARLLREYELGNQINTNIINKLIMTNIESLLIAFISRKSNETIQDLIKHARSQEIRAISKDEKRNIITANENKLNKIADVYFKSYPEKANKI